jgi:hypothetical protein
MTSASLRWEELFIGAPLVHCPRERWMQYTWRDVLSQQERTSDVAPCTEHAFVIVEMELDLVVAEDAECK